MANYGIFRCRGKIAPQTAAHHHQQAAPYIIVIDNFNDARAFSSRQRRAARSAALYADRRATLHAAAAPLILDISYFVQYYMVERAS